MLKIIGFYSMILGVINIILFFFVIFGNRSLYFLLIGIAIIGCLLSLIGLFYDNKKLYSSLSLLILALPVLIHWLAQKP